MSSSDAVLALGDIIKNQTHIARQMPAYDLNGDLIDPARYASKLIGATVTVRFVLQHYVISRKDRDGNTRVTSDTFTASLDYLRIAINPDSKGPVTPRKKKPGKMDTVYGDWSPTKRPHDSGGEDDQGPSQAGRRLRKKKKNQGLSAAPSTSAQN